MVVLAHDSLELVLTDWACNLLLLAISMDRMESMANWQSIRVLSSYLMQSFVVLVYNNHADL